MIWGDSWIYITIIAVLIDFTLGELPGKHPVQFIGDFIKAFEKKSYKDSVLRGFILLILLVGIIAALTVSWQNVIIKLPKWFGIPAYIPVLILGVLSSTGLASKTLKKYVKDVLMADDNKRREYLAGLVSRNTSILDDKKVYSSLIETYSENLSDGLIAPLFYLILFGFPGIMVFKTVSTLDSMIGYKNEKYLKFGSTSAICDDVLNFIPARITAFLIWILSVPRITWNKLVKDAVVYSTSPNAGYPVSAAAYNLGVKLGGSVYYGETLVNKAEIGEERTENYRQAAFNFFKIHTAIEFIIVATLILVLTYKLLHI